MRGELAYTGQHHVNKEDQSPTHKAIASQRVLLSLFNYTTQLSGQRP